MTRIEKLPGFPIILVTEKGQVNQKYVQRNMMRVGDLAKNVDGQAFLVVDTRHSDANFANTLQVGKAWRDYAARTDTPRVILVGGSPYARLLRDLLSQHQEQPIPLFDNLADALECARLQVRDRQAVAL